MQNTQLTLPSNSTPSSKDPQACCPFSSFMMVKAYLIAAAMAAGVAALPNSNLLDRAATCNRDNCYRGVGNLLSLP
jgi:hypothetical protein